MNFLTKEVNSPGFTEKQLNSYEDRRKFLGGDMTCTTVLGNIDIWSLDDMCEMSVDNLSVIIHYGKDEDGEDIKGYIFGPCYFATCDDDGNTIPLSQDDLSKFLKNQCSARLRANDHYVVVINAYENLSK